MNMENNTLKPMGYSKNSIKKFIAMSTYIQKKKKKDFK
jgi:hypothetical protein